MHPADNNIAKWSHCIDYQIDQFAGDNTDWKLCVLVMKKATLNHLVSFFGSCQPFSPM